MTARVVPTDAEVLHQVTAALSVAHDVQAVAHVICEVARTGVGAAGSFVAVRVEAGFAMLGTGGLTRPTADAHRTVPAEAPLPPTEAARTGRPVLVRTRAERDARFPLIAAGQTDDHGSFAAVPMIGRDGQVVGVVNFSWRDEHGVDRVPEVQLLALATQCALALERARLYDAEQVARREAEATAERLALLQSMTARLSQAVDGRSVAGTILDLAQQVFGGTGWAVYRVEDGEESLSLMVDRGMDPPLPAVVALDADLPVAVAARSAQRTVPPLVDGRRGPVWGPLQLGGKVVGLLGVQGHDLAAAAAIDADLRTTVSQLCAQALERAALYDTSNEIALTLQRSLLPHALPSIPGLEVAVRYRPVGGRTVVGGDFYDVFRVAPGRWGVVVGDVAGKGVRAASLTALARYTVRAVAAFSPLPSDVLAALNNAVLDRDEGDDRFCTAAYLDVEPGPGGAAVRLTVGGHPLPVLRAADGSLRRVGSPGMALGLLPLAEVDDAELALGPGEVLVLVTDGVTEARSPDGTWVEDCVERALGVGLDDPSEDAEAVADRIERLVLDVQAGRPRDDLAVVVLRVPGEGAEPVPGAISMSLTLECEARSAGIARRRVAELLRDRGDERAAEVLELLVSEVVTNALVHAGTAVGVRVALAADRAHVEVTDSSTRSPVRRDARLDATGGRGLLLLDRLAAAWGVRRLQDGKVVWFDIDLAPGGR